MADTNPMKPGELSIRGWGSWLAALTAGTLAVEAVTGIWLYLAPFSVWSQVQLLVHVAAGLLMVVCGGWYLVQHFLAWYLQKVTAVMVLGYALAATVVACAVSGIVVAWQSLFGPGLSPVWDLVHLVSGLVTAVLVVVHLVTAIVRRRAPASGGESLRSARRRFARRAATAGGAAGVVVVGTGWLVPVPTALFDAPDHYRLSEYAEQFDEYRGNPFAPSYARTHSGQLVSPEVLSGSHSCGTSGCHEQILAEWEPSAHRFSAMNPPFQQIQKDFAADRDPAETRYCAGCHDPISLFAGAKDIHNLSLSAPGMQEGVGCVVCHAIDQVDQRGNGDYVLVPPRKYLWEGETGWKKQVSDFLIRAYPRQHVADYDRPVLRSPEFCGACHKQFIPEALNRFGLVAGQNQYDEWRKSHWHHDDPDQRLSCVDCHMPLVRDSTDPARGEEFAIRRRRDDGAHRHHGTIATNFLMPQVLKLPHWETQVELTERWIRGETVIEEIAHLWPPGPVAELQIVAPQRAAAEEDVSLRVVVSNRKAGHNLTTGPLDFMQAWVHLSVTDAAGDVVAEWGALDPVTRDILDEPGKTHQIGNSRKEGTLVLEGIPIDADGEPLLEHELWRSAGGKGKRVIFPGHADNQQYSFRVPVDARGPLRVRADFNFRRYRQDFLDRTVPHMERDSGVRQPIITQTSAEATIELGGLSEPRP